MIQLNKTPDYTSETRRLINAVKTMDIATATHEVLGMLETIDMKATEKATKTASKTAIQKYRTRRNGKR